MRSTVGRVGALASLGSLVICAALGGPALAQAPAGGGPPRPAMDPGMPALMPAFASLRAVALMTDTGQALFWDDARHEYAVLRVGEERDGWRLVAVEKTRAVVVQGAGVREELELVLAPTEITSAPPPRGKKRTTAFVVETDPRPIAPAVEPLALALSLTPAAPAPAGFLAALDGRMAPTEPAFEKRNVKRAEFDREIGNFDRLLDQVTVAPAAGGGVVLQRMKSTFLGKLGLKEGDVVRTVAGEQVSTVESAARVYAQLRSASSFVVEIDRAGARVVIRCDLG